jgi:1-acyl-sn-glycerol-3-phosphate acyltransferase
VPKKGLLVSNHLSYLDILVLGAITPSVFVAKREVRSWPLFGWFARMAGTVFVRRDCRRDTIRVNWEIVRALQEKVLVVLFPEGTSSDGQTVLPFKSPLLASVTGKAHPVWAGFIDYALQEGSVSKEVCYWRDMTLAPHLLNLLGKPAIAARVAVARCHCALEGGRERKELAHRLRSSVLSLKETFGFSQILPGRLPSEVLVRMKSTISQKNPRLMVLLVLLILSVIAAAGWATGSKENPSLGFFTVGDTLA